ncbi:hypothetical protein A4E84_38915 [Streptomyces qaidamensis]|uniref:Uncharacterized protein n=1 Tax=Streptomyces qaidamensis TaxID=1783515 RepID=A0A143CBW1_9ACTN|nr:hypothetical protein A4E84_38915 [Streptomyces qaidamensis]
MGLMVCPADDEVTSPAISWAYYGSDHDPTVRLLQRGAVDPGDNAAGRRHRAIPAATCTLAENPPAHRAAPR